MAFSQSERMLYRSYFINNFNFRVKRLMKNSGGTGNMTYGKANEKGKHYNMAYCII
jgi:hypothetical protein